MNKKFVVVVEGLSTEHEKLFRDFIDKDGSGWWHMVGEVWLIDALSDELTVEKIRNKIMSLSKNPNILVLEISPITWAAYGPESKERSFSKWVEEFWTENK